MITLKEAIETLYDLVTTKPQIDPEKRREAVRLGIEALKRTRQARVRKEPYWGALLPGEIEE